MRKKNYTKKEREERERKMNEIFDKTTKLFQSFRTLEKRRKRMDFKFDLIMGMLVIANILLFILGRSFFTMWNIGFVCGMWIANILYRGIRRL